MDSNSIAPVIEKEFEKITEKIANNIDDNIREFFVKNTEIFNNNFEKVLTKTISKDCDNDTVIAAISRLKNDFSMLIKEAKEVEPTENNSTELKKWFVLILDKLDNIKVPQESITVENKGLLFELKKLKNEIVYEINNSFGGRNSEINYDVKKEYHPKRPINTDAPTEYKNIKQCPQCYLDYANCECPKLVEEKIDRKILFEYARNGERSPFHDTYSYENNFNK
jgi:hypothetical protein